MSDSINFVYVFYGLEYGFASTQRDVWLGALD
jgi:hypothetical protein